MLDAVRELLPQYDYAYYGDTAHLPYGEKDEEEIYRLTKIGVEHLFTNEDCVLVMLACNTASAETLRRLQDQYLPTAFPERRILGVIIPTVEAVLESKSTNVLLLATSRTVSSGKYHVELGKRNDNNLTIQAVAMSKLVPLIESGDVEAALDEVRSLLKSHAAQSKQYDGIILGCTHYSLLAAGLREVVGGGVTFFAQTEIIPEKIKLYLTDHPELLGKLSEGNSVTELLTGNLESQ